MSGRHKFSELERRMIPARRARIDKMARKLDAEVSAADSRQNVNVDYKILHKLSYEFTQLWSRLHGFYLDAVAGFEFV